jgi:protein-tyrosine-phosphatase
MGYKRKAHVLFVASGEASRAAIAALFANTLGQRYMEARAVCLDRAPLTTELRDAMRASGVVTGDEMLCALNASSLAWADLLVTLDEAADRACPALPKSVQKRCYVFARPNNLVSLQLTRDAIKQRIEGMIAGMAMIA